MDYKNDKKRNIKMIKRINKMRIILTGSEQFAAFVISTQLPRKFQTTSLPYISCYSPEANYRHCYLQHAVL